MELHCFTPANRMKCCHRSVVGAHKMGWQILIKINRNYLARIPGGQVRKSELHTVHHITIDTQSSSWNKEYELLTNLTCQLEQDYRTVFVTRNWYDTIISGYLYKSGRECWLSSGGKSGHWGWLLHFNWEEFLEKKRGRTTQYWPNLTATKLCKYLQIATPEDGLRVYADLAIAYWLNSVAALANARNVTPPAKSRIPFLCYEQFNVNENFPDAIKEAGSFLYPADDIAQWDGMVSTNQGGGGHATTTDNALRLGLHAMLRIIDSEHLDGEINAVSLKFGCVHQRPTTTCLIQNLSRTSYSMNAFLSTHLEFWLD